MFDFLKPRDDGGGLVKAAAQARDAALSLDLPNPWGGRPWLSATFAVTRAPRSQGDMLRLRVHVDSCLHMPGRDDAPALDDAREGTRSLTTTGRKVVAAATRELLARLPAEQLAPLTQRRRRSWLDVQVSTAPLDRGADALVPERLRDMLGDGLPQGDAGEPRIGMWSGPAGGPRGGVASLVWLQMDEQDFPGAEQNHEAGTGFNLNASMSQLVEPVSGRD